MAELGSYLEQLLSEHPTQEAASALAFLAAGVDYQVVEAAAGPVRAIALQEGLPVFGGIRDVPEEYHHHAEATYEESEEVLGTWECEYPENTDPAFEDQLPVLQDPAGGPEVPSTLIIRGVGKGGMLGGRARRGLAFDPPREGEGDPPPRLPLSPSYDPMRRRAPAAAWGPPPPRPAPAAKVKGPKAPADERPLPEVKDDVIRPRTPAASFGTAPRSPPRPASAASSATATPASTPGRGGKGHPSPRSVLPASPKYNVVERSCHVPSFGRYSKRDFVVPGMGVVTVEEVSRSQAKRELDLAAAYAATLPKQAATKFGTSARFSWDFKGEALRARHVAGEEGGEGGEGKAPPAGGKAAAAAAPEAPCRIDLDNVKPRAPGAKITPPPKAKVKAGEKDAAKAEEAPPTAAAAGDPKFDLVFRRVTVARWAPPAPPGAKAQRARTLRRPAPGPSHYRGAGSAADKISTRRNPPGVKMAPPVPKRAPPPRPIQPEKLTEAVLDIPRAMDATRTRAPATSFDKGGTRFKEPPPPPEEEAAEPYIPRPVQWTLVERSPPGVAIRPDVGGRRAPEGEEGEVGVGPGAYDDSMAAVLPRHPAWGFDGPTRIREEPLVAPRVPLHPNYAAVRPGTVAVGWGKYAPREGEPVARPYLARHPEPAQYDVWRAFDFLDKHVPAAVWELAATRWAGGVVGGLLEGGEEAMLELSRAVALTRPSPPAWGFAPVPSHVRRVHARADGRVMHALEPSFALVRRREGLGCHAFDLQMPRELKKIVMRAVRAELGMYSPQYNAVEPRVKGIADMAHMAGHRPDGQELRETNGESGEEGARELEVEAAALAVLPRKAMYVDMRKMPPRPGPAPPRETAEHDLPGPQADVLLRARVAGVDLEWGGGHQLLEEERDPDAWKRGPGMYNKEGPITGGTHEPIGVATPAADFTKPRGRYTRAEEEGRVVIREGDRLIIDPAAAVDVLRPRAPAVGFPMEAARGPSPPSVYEGTEDLPRLLDADRHVFWERGKFFGDFKRMAARWSADMPHRRRVPLERPAPQYDWARGEAVVSNYPPAPVSFVREWARYKGRSIDAEPKGVQDGQRLDLEVKDHLTRRRRPVPDFDGYLGRFDPAADKEDWLDYYPDEALLRPATRAVDFTRALGHGAPAAPRAADDLDAGCYYPERAVVDREPRAAEFGRMGVRFNPLLTRSEGDNLFLHPLARQDVGAHHAAPLREGRREQPMGAWEPRWEGAGRVPEDDRALFLRVETGAAAEASRGKMGVLPEGTNFHAGPGRAGVLCVGLREGRALQPGAVAEAAGAYQEHRDAKAIYGAFPAAHVAAAEQLKKPLAGPRAKGAEGTDFVTWCPGREQPAGPPLPPPRENPAAREARVGRMMARVRKGRPGSAGGAGEKGAPIAKAAVEKGAAVGAGRGAATGGGAGVGAGATPGDRRAEARARMAARLGRLEVGRVTPSKNNKGAAAV